MSTGTGWTAVIRKPNAARVSVIRRAREEAQPLLRSGMSSEVLVLSLTSFLYEDRLSEAEAAAALVLAHCQSLIDERGL